MKKFLKWYYGEASIRKKLVISYLILVLLPIVILGTYSYKIAKNNLIYQTTETVKNNVSAIGYSLNSDIQREYDNIKYLSYNSNFREKLGAVREQGNITSLVQEMNTQIEPTFWYFITSDGNIKSIEIFSPYIKNSIGSFLKPYSVCENESWFPYHEKNFKTQWSCEEGKIFATRTLLDSATSSKPIGIMKLEVFYDRFIDSLYQTQYLENGVVLIDDKEKIVAQRHIGDKALDNEIMEKIKKLPDGDIIQDRRYIICSGERLSNGWSFYYYVDMNKISFYVNKIFKSTALMVFICLVILTLFISIISKLLTTRIMELKGCAEKVGRGEFDIDIDTHYTDEIGVVAKSFNKMSHKINDMIDEVYKMGLEKRATELKALQAMINPHFLYNCLSGIKWKAIKSDQEEIANITGLLAKFYRTTLNDGRQITIVKNELENVIAYLEIQLGTHEGSFDVEYTIDSEGQELDMPNFVLQPIVENAICHGIECCENERGYIKIEFKCQEEFLVFNIYNNGPVIDKERLESILTAPGKGYGLYNIQERIAMYYDKECGVSASTGEDMLICFTVRIRKEPKKSF